MAGAREVEIEAGKSGLFPDIQEAWAGRMLLTAFVRRGMAVRYRQAIFGLFWAFMQPAINVAIFTFVFKRVANLSSDGLPYSVFAAIGMTIWFYFSRALQEASNTLVANQTMVTKVWFPRILLPLSQVVEALVEYGVMLVLVAALCIWHGVVPGWHLTAYPLFVLLAVFTCAGFSFWFSALNVSFRDVRVILPFALQAGLFATPIIWSPADVAPWLKLLNALNPMAVVIDGMRWCLGGTGALMNPACIGISLASGLAIFLGGAIFFARRERHFADII